MENQTIICIGGFVKYNFPIKKVSEQKIMLKEFLLPRRGETTQKVAEISPRFSALAGRLGGKSSIFCSLPKKK